MSSSAYAFHGIMRTKYVHVCGHHLPAEEEELKKKIEFLKDKFLSVPYSFSSVIPTESGEFVKRLLQVHLDVNGDEMPKANEDCFISVFRTTLWLCCSCFKTLTVPDCRSWSNFKMQHTKPNDICMML